MNRKVKILIVEDEVLIAEFIREMLLDEGFESVEVVHDCTSALHYFKQFAPEILLLDINIEGKDTGIALAQKRNPEAKIIYITAQNDEATLLKAIETSPDNYLTKPIKKIDVIAAIKLASLKKIKESVQIKDGFKEVKILLNDILFVKSDGNYIDIQTVTKKYSIRQSLDSFLLELNSDMFCKIHRSYIVNKQKITVKTSTSVFIKAIEIPISRSCTLEF